MPESFETRLNCVAIPLLHSDLSSGLNEVLRLWDDPRFFPRRSATAPRPHLLVMVNNAAPVDLANAKAKILGHASVSSCFAGVTVQSAGLTGDRDLYIKDQDQRRGLYGTRAGPNFLFQATVNAASRFGGFCLQAELDCLPVQSGWLEDTQRVIDGHTSAWIVGTHYAGEGNLDPWLQTHLNGNALYRAGDRRFLDFLNRIWMARVLKHIQTFEHLAYDCWWAYELAGSDPTKNNKAWKLFQAYNGYFHSDHFITNLLASPEEAQDYITVLQRVRSFGEMPVFFHGPALNRFRQELLANPGESIFDAIDRLSPPAMGRGALPILSREHPTSATMPEGNQKAATRLLLRTAAKILLAPEQAASLLDQAGLEGGALMQAAVLLGPDDRAWKRLTNTLRLHAPELLPTLDQRTAVGTSPKAARQ